MMRLPSLRQTLPLLKQFSLYFVSGVIANLLDIGIYEVLLQLKLWYLTASIISGIVSFFAAFFLQKFAVFAARDHTGAQLLRFCLLGLFNLVAVNIILYGCVRFFGIPETWAKFIGNGSQVLWGYFIGKLFIYV